MLQLFDLQATDLVTASNVGVAGFVGQDGDEPPNPADNFSGSEMFGNEDGKLTADELRNNELISLLLAPDVDLFDAGGNFNPRVDGVDDSLSFGVGFTAVGAVFDPP